MQDQAGTERLRRARWTSASSAIAYGITILTGLVAVPITVNYLGHERYGVWVTLSSLLTWLAMLDLGLAGNALVNALAEADGKDDRDLGRELIATAFWALAAIGTVILLISAAAATFVSWRTVFNVSAAVSERELALASGLGLAFLALGLPANAAQAVFSGYQEGYWSSFLGAGSSFASLAALVLVARSEGGLPSLVLALSGARLVVVVAGSVVLFGLLRPWLRPSPKAATRRAVRRLLSLGGPYLIAQLAGIGLFQSQPMIITRILGPEAVGVFSVAQRVLTLPLVAVQLLTVPLMPAYGEARARGEWTWIMATLRRSTLQASALGIGLTVPLVVSSRWIIGAWVGPGLIPDSSLVTSLAAYTVIAAIVTPFSVMLYGVEQVRGQARIAFANAVVTVSGAVWLTSLLGVAGTAWAMGLGMMAVNGLGQLLEVRRVLRTRVGAQDPGAVL
jgi:O-antigen/teichoic acid export membrane protein